MSGITANSALAWVLIAFFVVGATINFIAPQSIREDYRRWGYPERFHYVTAVLELTVALLLIFPATRLAGAMLGGAVMAAASGTTLFHRDYARAVAPTVVLVMAATLGWLSWLR